MEYHMQGSNPFSLEGLAALITGSGRNIGRATALAFARAGASVTINGRNDAEAAAAVVREIVDEGGRAIAIMGDAADRAQAEALVKGTQEAFGSLDIVVANAGVRPLKPFLELSEDDWQGMMSANLHGPFHLAQAALPGMIEKGYGRFVHLSGLPVFTGRYQQKTAPVASKSGLHGLTKGLADEFGVNGVTANLVAPGMIDTTRDWRNYPGDQIHEHAKMIPTRRLGSVNDVAYACLYLASDAAGHINGQTIHVNGGEVMF
jgi:3-oxoacyl-[acyl-carrier protein] reductase